MARPRIAMSADELAAFLAAKRIGVIGTVGADGGPDAEAASITWKGHELTFRVARDGTTHRNTARDPRVVCAIEEFPSYAEIRGVSVHGRAVQVGDTPAQVVFRIADARIESFDFRKMARAAPKNVE
jgi:nitroimidazol reductase NimA-like FMN-containing flavoprotein (pyridoxamine 5'-phosphate oxidase superfamily)